MVSVVPLTGPLTSAVVTVPVRAPPTVPPPPQAVRVSVIRARRPVAATAIVRALPDRLRLRSLTASPPCPGKFFELRLKNGTYHFGRGVARKRCRSEYPSAHAPEGPVPPPRRARRR